jgi:hypothetical protein
VGEVAEKYLAAVLVLDHDDFLTTLRALACCCDLARWAFCLVPVCGQTAAIAD